MITACPRIAPAIALLLAVMATSCTKVDDDDGMGTHACASGSNSDWSSFGANLTIEHQQPEQCPIQQTQGQQLTVGGSVIETPAPTFPALGVTSSLSVQVWQNYSVNVFLGSGSLGYKSDTFDYADNFGGDWEAQTFVTYNFGLNPDWLEFRVTCYGTGCDFPAAYVEINNGGPE